MKNLSTQNIDATILILLSSVDSINTVRAYRCAMLDFRQWYIERGQGDLSKVEIQSNEELEAYKSKQLVYSKFNLT